VIVANRELQIGNSFTQALAYSIVICPHGDPHLLGNGSPAKPLDSLKRFAKNLTQGLKLARFGGGGEVTGFVCGFMACEPFRG
jgi:hypothetical protein